MSPRNEIDAKNLMLSRTSIHEYEKLYNVDVLGVQDVQESYENILHKRLKQQLRNLRN